jgi:hypothetical protein
MTYYEELGLTQSASTEAIRQAYKNVTRLWHPDQYQDEKLREVAECQMKRLNQIVAMLTDPVQRMQYDAQLEAAKGGIEVKGVPKPPPVSGVEAVRALLPFLNLENLAWTVIGLIGLVSVLILFTPPGGTQIQRAKSQATSDLQDPGLKAHRPSSPSLPARATVPLLGQQHEGNQPTQGFQEPVKIPATKGAADPPPIGELAAPPFAAGMGPVETPHDGGAAKEITARDTSFADSSARPEAAPAKAAVPSKPPSLAGNWFYVRSKDGAPPGFYLPEYIELTITTAGGSIEGYYRARYHILDRPISPDVVFQFRGPMSSGTARYPWTAPSGGAKGEVQLKLISVMTLEINWWATELGNNPGLASGTAVLVRQQEP